MLPRGAARWKRRSKGDRFGDRLLRLSFSIKGGHVLYVYAASLKWRMDLIRASTIRNWVASSRLWGRISKLQLYNLALYTVVAAEMKRGNDG